MVAEGIYPFYSKIGTPSLENILLKLNKEPAKLAINPFIREILFGNFKNAKEKRLALKYFSLINFFLNHERQNYSDLSNFFALELFSLVYVGYADQQAFIKALLTNYSVSEEKIQQEAVAEQITREVDEKKKKKFGFFKW